MKPATLIPKQLGNMYTASIYAAFASLIHNKSDSLVCIAFTLLTKCFYLRISNLFLLKNLWGHFPFLHSKTREENKRIKYLKCIFFFLSNFQDGNRVMMFSYGSGLSATMFSLHLSEGKGPFSLSNIAKVLNIDHKLKTRTEVCY